MTTDADDKAKALSPEQQRRIALYTQLQMMLAGYIPFDPEVVKQLPVKTAEEQAEAVRRRYRLLRERRGEFAAPDPDSVRVEDFQPIHYDVERIRQEIIERQNNPFWNPNAKT